MPIVRADETTTFNLPGLVFTSMAAPSRGSVPVSYTHLGIEKIRSSFALKQVRYKTALPLPRP